MDSNETPPPPFASPQSGNLPPPPPPPLAPPPLISPVTPPAPSRRGRGWMVIAIILMVLLLLSVFANFSQMVSGISSIRSTTSRSHTRTIGPKLDEVILEENGSSAKIAVIDVEGIISSRSEQGGFTMVDLIKAQLRHAADDRRVKAVILKVDSPGGEVLASDEIYDAIERFQRGDDDRPGKPVIASMGNLAASGGYYVSAPCRWIVANELTITGSIGVIMHGFNYRGLMDKIGLAPDVYKSGKFKDMLSGSRRLDEIPPEERAMVQALIDEVYGKFKGVVAEGREAAHNENPDCRPLAGDWEQYADGRVFSGSEAYRLGFVDQLGNFDDAVERAKVLGNVSDNANLIKYQQRYDLSDFFRLFGQSESRVVKVDVGIEPPPRLVTGQLYFLSPTSLY